MSDEYQPDPANLEPVYQPNPANLTVFDPHEEIAQRATQHLAEYQSGQYGELSPKEVFMSNLAAQANKPFGQRFFDKLTQGDYSKAASDIYSGVKGTFEDYAKQQYALIKKAGGDAANLDLPALYGDYETAKQQQVNATAGAAKGALSLAPAALDLASSAAQGTIGGAIGSVSPRGEQYFDAGLNTATDLVRHGVNAGADTLAKLAGADTKSPEGTIAENIAPFLVPVGAGEAASGKINKLSEKIVSATDKAGARVSGVAGKTLSATAPVTASVAARAPEAAVGAAIGAEFGHGPIGALIGAFVRPRRLQSAVEDMIKAKGDEVAQAARAIVDSPAGTAPIDAVQNASRARLGKLQEAIDFGKSKLKAPEQEALVQAFENPDMMEHLSADAKKVFDQHAKAVDLGDKIDLLEKNKDFALFQKQVSEMLVSKALHSAQGAAVMGGLAGASSPPGDTGAVPHGVLAGALIGGAASSINLPPELIRARRAYVRAPIIRTLVEKAKNAYEAHPLAQEAQAARVELSPEQQNALDKTSGFGILSGGKPTIPLKGPDLIRALKDVEGIDVTEAPEGYAGKDVNYVNADTYDPLSAYHELGHDPKIINDPKVISATEKMVTDDPEGVQTSLDKYNVDLARTSPDTPPLTLDSAPNEIVAAIAADILRDIPPEALFGGRTGGQLLTKWFQDHFGGNEPTTQYGFKVTRDLRNAVRDKLFDLGSEAEASAKAPLIAPGSPRTAVPEIPATTTPPEQQNAPQANLEAKKAIPEVIKDATDGLRALDYGQKEAREMAESAAAELGPQASTADIVRLAIRKKANPVSINPIIKSNIEKRNENEKTGKTTSESIATTGGERTENEERENAISYDEGTAGKSSGRDVRSDLLGYGQQGATSIPPTGVTETLAELNRRNARAPELPTPLNKGLVPQINESQPETKIPSIPAEAAPERGVAPVVSQATSKAPDVAVAAKPKAQGVDYNSIRQQATAAKTQELSGTKRKTKAAEIERAGIEAMAQAHARENGQFLPAKAETAKETKRGTDLVTWRTDRYGKTSISGARLDPNDPFHQILLDEANLSPADRQKLLTLQANNGKTVAIDYLHAPEQEAASGISRKGEQAESTATERVAGEKATRRLTKSFVPTWITFNLPSKTIEVNGFSPDKFLNNASLVIPEANRLGLKGYKDINDPRLVQDFNAMVENHKNGYTASGKPIEGTPLTPVKQNLDFAPTIIPKDRADILNSMLGNEGAKIGKRATPEKADKQILAQQNSPYWEPSTGETNAFRAKLGDTSKLLEPTSETLRPELIDKVRSEPVADEQTLRSTGFTGDRAAFAAKGAPNQTFAAGGFLPSKSPNAIKGPAYKFADGNVIGIRGDAMHFNLIHEIDKHYGDKADEMLAKATKGWITNDGEFLATKPAYDRALAAGQMTEEAYKEAEAHFGNGPGSHDLESLSFQRAKKKSIPSVESKPKALPIPSL